MSFYDVEHITFSAIGEEMAIKDDTGRGEH